MLAEIITYNLVADTIADFARESLLEEVYLTPKPGLVDRENNGSHHDLNLTVMESSALALRSVFYEMAIVAAHKKPSLQLREELGAIGRYGERKMLEATGGINAHKGAIWSIGLLVAATSILSSGDSVFTISNLLNTAGAIARFDDQYQPSAPSNGKQVSKKYKVVTAREEAALGFPSLSKTALPTWRKYQNESENICRINVLLSLISVVDDTCILHRSDMKVLRMIKQKAKDILDRGGMGIPENQHVYQDLDDLVRYWWVSPGGSADMLAASIFIHKVTHHFTIN
ncbi:triphosphoribosyl-dephospho-CoA synthase [Chryseobacterium rhizosphaerae]|uniref:triphosphoribosyl-dephospho-CoA synthase n=1 Tax=Chryseobacterium rhizosphaerae TaxID=395937 RepID=A0ABX9IG10_9FLAO|nr:triphosphoribosyl-dephospho-CoA synthase [Chryseobacterium rhizosphaerae]REC72630.1 triphosphoribosyl-dephospho-CoA synthase MdcB [Chryseobacterium rhizosphaerae]GEN69235.1 putative 2-(5''-triphosphoribosyl)-3'-dephosphocoenzyme-A synthase [Chryseobacterium rhizosphaerae]